MLNGLMDLPGLACPTVLENLKPAKFLSNGRPDEPTD
jgi:hypothetical protein